MQDPVFAGHAASKFRGYLSICHEMSLRAGPEGPLADRAMHPVTMYLLLETYLMKLPGAVHEVQRSDGTLACCSKITQGQLT
jgi:hypothetical protein